MEAASVHVASQRLPSVRAIDRRWDRSRGLIFSHARRPHTRDLRWCLSNGIVFADEVGAARGYATRSLGTPPASRHDPSVKHPNIAPAWTPTTTSKVDEATPFAAREAELRGLIKVEKGHVAELAKEKSRMEESLKRLERQLGDARRREKEKARESRALVEDTRRQVEQRLEKKMVETQKLRHDATQQLGSLRKEVKELTDQMTSLTLRRSKELTRQRQALNRDREEQVRAMLQERGKRAQERSSYDAYRQVYDDLNSTAFPALSRHLVSIEVSYFMAAKCLAEQPSYASRIEAAHPWVNLKYPGLLERLDKDLSDRQREVRQTGEAVQSLRLEQQGLQDAFKAAAHTSRALTRFHHMDETPNKLSATDTLYWLANDQPFRARRDEIDAEIKRKCRSIFQEKDEAVVKRHKKDLRSMQAERAILNRIMSVHMKVRDTEALKSLLTDSLAEKEVFAVTFQPKMQIEEATAGWQSLTGDSPLGFEDSDVSRGEQMTVRHAFIDKLRYVRQMQRKIQALVRRRSLLEKNLGKISMDRMREVDAIIRDQITLRKVKERSAFARLGTVKAAGRTSVAQPTRIAFSVSHTPHGPDTTQSSLAPRTESKAASVVDAEPSPTHNSDLSGNDITSLRKMLSRLLSSADGPASSTDNKAAEKLRTARNQENIKQLSRLTALQEEAVKQHGPKSEIVQKYNRQIRSVVLNGQFIENGSRIRRRERRNERRAAAGAESMMRSRAELRSFGTRLASSTGAPLNFKPTAIQQAPYPLWPFYNRMTKPNSDRLATQQSSVISHSTDPYDNNSVYAPSSTSSDVKPLATSPADANRASVPQSGYGPPTETALDVGGPLTFQIPAQDYRDAVMSSKSSAAAFWTYKLYKSPSGAAPTLHYCQKFAQAQEQAKKFLNEPVVGFDVEWDPYNRPGVKYNVSLIQIAAEDKIALFQIARFIGDTPEQLMPPALRTILESDQIAKAGVNVAGDATRIRKWLGVEMKGLFELSHLYKVVRYSEGDRSQINKKLTSLATQVQQVMLLPMRKDDEVRVSSWSRQLNLQQVEYSATDAYAGFRLFHALEAKRKKMDPMPPRPAFHELHKPLVLGDGAVFVAKSKKHVTAAKDKTTEPDDDDDDNGRDDDDDDDDTDEEFFDAVENLDRHGKTTDAPRTSSVETVPASAFAKREPPPSMEIELADSWIADYRATLSPDCEPKCGNAALRAWHLWHMQGFGIKRVASFARDPPLAPATVANYILDAARKDNLPFSARRVKEALGLIPRNVLGRYKKILEKVKAATETGDC